MIFDRDVAASDKAGFCSDCMPRLRAAGLADDQDDGRHQIVQEMRRSRHRNARPEALLPPHQIDQREDHERPPHDQSPGGGGVAVRRAP